MKTLRLFPLLICILFAFSCEDDLPNSCLYFEEYLNGKIEGTVWDYETGIVEMRADNTMNIDLFGTDEVFLTTPCDVLFGITDNVSLNLPAAVGDYSLVLDSSGGNNRTLTLYDAETSQNIIMTEGCVQVSRITETQIEMKFDVGDGASENFLRGEATLEICL